jgi:hypothetical protein
MRIIRTQDGKFIPSRLSPADGILHHPVPTRGDTVLVTSFEDREFFEQRALHHRKLVPPFVAGVDLAIQRRIGQGAGQNGLVPVRHQHKDRPVPGGGVVINEHHQIGYPIIVQVVDLDIGYPAPDRYCRPSWSYRSF